MPEAGVVLPIKYTADEVSRRFTELLGTFDYAAELHELGFGSLSLFKRSQARRHFTALSMALWRIALGRSFPEDAETFYAHFLDTHPLVAGERKRARLARDLVQRYAALLAEKGDADFSGIAQAMADDLRLPSGDRASRQLRLSLRIRGLYEVIFNNLI